MGYENINENVKIVDGGSLQSANGDIKLTINSEGDDQGFVVDGGQFSVGTADDGRESVFGEGDSYPVPIAFHCDIADTTGLTITGATDISEILQSDSDSTTGLFGGTTAGKYILVGSIHSYGGVKAKTDTGGTAEPDNVFAEYLQDNSPTWVDAKFMSTNSGFPYDSRANVLAAVAGSEQWRFGYDPQAGIPTWELVTLNINGVDYEYRWARFRIETAITSDPVMEQIKIHTNRYEINADGNTEYFGRARYARDLTMHWVNTIQLNGLSPANEDITFANGLVLDYTDNEFANNTTDGRGGYLILPSGIDTSIDVHIEFLWTPMSNGSGDVVYEILYYQAAVGDVISSANTPVTNQEIVTIDANSDNVLTKTIVTIPINELMEGEILAFGFKRLGSDASDTYTSAIAMINVRAIGYFWRP